VVDKLPLEIKSYIISLKVLFPITRSLRNNDHVHLYFYVFFIENWKGN